MKIANQNINNKQAVFFWISLISFILVICLERKWYIDILVVIMYLCALWIFSFQDKTKKR